MKRALALIIYSSQLGGCGLSYTRLPEIWDQTDPDATYNMEVQIKQTIFCELKKAAHDLAPKKSLGRETNDGKNIATAEDGWFPNDWGILMQLTIQAEEKSNLTPGLSFKTPIHNAPVNFPGETIGASGALAATTYGPLSVGQSYTLGLGGQLSSANMRSDKYNAYYTAKDLNVWPKNASSGTGPCRPDYFRSVPKSTSSPFLDASNLGIRDWLSAAVRVINFERSSRANENGEGPALQSPGVFSDSSTYDNRFIIITDASIAPNWSLVRIGTPSTPLFDASRTRTHELILTVGPGTLASTKPSKPGQVAKVARSAAEPSAVAPSAGAVAAFNAQLIGSAVANSIASSLRAQ